MANLETIDIEWCAEHSTTDLEPGERAVVCDYEGHEIARGEIKHEASGWNWAASVNGLTITTWPAIRDVECWTAAGKIVYVYREYDLVKVQRRSAGRCPICNRPEGDPDAPLNPADVDYNYFTGIDCPNCGGDVVQFI